MSDKRSKSSGRGKATTRVSAADIRLKILETIYDGLIVIESARHPRVVFGQDAEYLERAFKEEDHRRAQECLRRQHRTRFVEIKKLGEKLSLVLTEKGEVMRLRLRLKAAPKRTDGKMIVVIFDIPERVAGVRQTLRQFLKSAGFKKLQDSVWMLDRSCEAEMAELIKKMDASKWVRCLLSEEIM